MITWFHDFPNGRRMYRFPDGNLGFSDPHRGIGLIVEPGTRPLMWVVVSMFRRLDNGEASAPFMTEYGKN